MKVGGIANIHPRQLFMNIKEQLWKVAGSFYLLSLSTGTHCNEMISYFIKFVTDICHGKG